jgi:hypothetical protein
MTDTTQEDVRLAKCCCDHDWFGPHQQGCPAYDPNEWADWYKAQLTAYQSLGSPEYLAALVEERDAETDRAIEWENKAMTLILERDELALMAAELASETCCGCSDGEFLDEARRRILIAKEEATDEQ